MMSRNIRRKNELHFSLAALLAVTGCSAGSALPGGGSRTAEGTASPPGRSGPSDDTKVLVRFVNETSAVVETLFYATNDAVESIPGDLFQPAHLVTVGIGVAGRGLLIPLSADSIEVPCSDDLILGTTGGRFQDPDLGTDLGVGPSRWLEEGAVFDCGAVITFTYKENRDGFTVEVSHEAP